MTTPPSGIIRRMLIDLEVVDEHTATGDGVWRAYSAFLPEGPDDAVCLYDTAGKFDGRMMRSGEKIEHPGLMIYLRGLSYERTWQKAKAIETVLDTYRRVLVAIPESESYLVHSISRTSPLMPLGVEVDGPKGKQRHQFTINAVITVAMATQVYLVGGEEYLLEPDGEPLYVPL